MKELIDFDAQFIAHMDTWADELLAQGKKAEEIEELIPEEYEKWAIEASKYFDDVEQEDLVKMLGAYMDEEITPPDFLIDKIMLSDKSEDKLVEMLKQERSTEDKILLMNILSSSEKPIDEYIRIILSDEDEELVEAATEALKYIPSQKLGAVKDALNETNDIDLKERFVYILVYASPKTEGLAGVLIDLIQTSANTAVIAGMMASYGDVQCLEILKKFEQAEGISYIDYVEICDAIEALGGETTREREFDGDDYYEMMHSGGIE